MMFKVIFLIYLFTPIYCQVIYDIDVERKTYYYRVETPDGTIKHESGHFELDPTTNEESLVIEGGYEYIGDNGLQYIVTYIADKNGYRPKVQFGVAQPPGGGTGGRGGAGGYAGGAGAYAGGAPQAGAVGPSGQAGAPPGKMIDPALLCSLAGSGCA